MSESTESPGTYTRNDLVDIFCKGSILPRPISETKLDQTLRTLEAAGRVKPKTPNYDRRLKLYTEEERAAIEEYLSRQE